MMPRQKTTACRSAPGLIQEVRHRDRDHRKNAGREDRSQAEAEGDEEKGGQALLGCGRRGATRQSGTALAVNRCSPQESTGSIAAAAGSTFSVRRQGSFARHALLCRCRPGSAAAAESRRSGGMRSRLSRDSPEA